MSQFDISVLQILKAIEERIDGADDEYDTEFLKGYLTAMIDVIADMRKIHSSDTKEIKVILDSLKKILKPS